MDETIEENFLYGFKQMMEVAIKALSPGINDPGTAVVSMRGIFKLLSYRLSFFPDTLFYNSDKQVRIVTKELTFEDIFTMAILPIWDYGKNDRLIQKELYHMLGQLQTIAGNPQVGRLMLQVEKNMKEKDF